MVVEVLRKVLRGQNSKKKNNNNIGNYFELLHEERCTVGSSSHIDSYGDNFYSMYIYHELSEYP